MQLGSGMKTGIARGAGLAMEGGLYWLSIYAVPALVVVFSALVWLAGEPRYVEGKGTAIEFRVVERATSEQEALSHPPEVAAVLAELAAVPPVQFYATHRSESPFWLLFSVPAASDGQTRHIEFPSRHARSIDCRDADTGTPLGTADRDATTGAFRPAKSGFVLDVLPSLSPTTELRVLCKTHFTGPARIALESWPIRELETSIFKFHRESGLLEGGLIVLCLFVLLTAIINREWLYVLFAGWLLLNLRMAALSMGWDIFWLDHFVPSSWLAPMRKLTMATYYLLTVTLFGRLFRDDLARLGHARLLAVGYWSCLPILLLALLLPYRLFLPPLWGATIIAIGTGVFLLIRLTFVGRSSVAAWYGASIAIMLLSSLYEVVSAALGIRELIGTINSVMAAQASTLMAALAIAEQMRQERLARMRAEAELRGTYEVIPIGLFSLDTTGEFVAANPAMREILGIESGPVTGRRWVEFFADATQDSLLRAATQGAELDLPGRADGPAAGKILRVKAISSGERIEGSLQDVTERIKAIERLRYLAEYDALTNTLNRRGVEKAFAESSRHMSDRRPLAIAYLDLDRFKLINDLFGHGTGDEVLRQVCTRIQADLGDRHHLGRVGGDEFVIIFDGMPMDDATALCRDLVARIEGEPYHIDDRAFQIRASIGLVEVADAAIAKDAISLADRACREAKKSSGALVVYDRHAPAFREREEELEMMGRFGIGRFGMGKAPEGLFLVMQPIMSLTRPHDCHNFEVLLRLREPDGSITPAWKLITAAENNGRISLIDRWVLSTLLKWLADNHARLTKTQFVCLNLSGASLNDEKFIEDAYRMLAEAGDYVKLLCFEITESVALHDLGNTNRFIDTVRGFGAKVALDDFGAGYTSFSYLKQLAADAVKIDGTFVRDVNAHPANLAIVEAIATLAHNLGMKTIAEWAEDLATVEALVEVGVDYVQGYAIARPMAPERILAANSSAELIEEARVASFVLDELGGQPHGRWQQSSLNGLLPASRH